MGNIADDIEVKQDWGPDGYVFEPKARDVVDMSKIRPKGPPIGKDRGAYRRVSRAPEPGAYFDIKLRIWISIDYERMWDGHLRPIPSPEPGAMWMSHSEEWVSADGQRKWGFAPWGTNLNKRWVRK